MKEIDARTFRNDVMLLISESSKIKSELFRATYRKIKIDASIIQKYYGYINGMIAQYSNGLENVTKDMKTSDPSGNISAYSYNAVKPYLYAKYDYAAVLQFTDGLYKGVSSGKLGDADDFEDFFSHTTSVAFKDLPDSTAAIVEDIAETFKDRNCKSVGKEEFAHFNAVKNQTIFNRRDREELYKSCVKTIDYISAQIDSTGDIDLDTDQVSLKIAFISNVLDFITYSIAAFAGRSTAIIQYGLNYVNNIGGEDKAVVDTVVESVVSDVNNKISDKEITIMKSADDMKYREPSTIKTFLELINNFANIMGTTIVNESDLKNKEDIYYNVTRSNDWDNDAPSGNDHNEFLDAFLGNPLFDMLHHRCELREFTSKGFDDMLSDMKSFMYNNAQALPTEVTPKQALVVIIRDTRKDKTSNEELTKTVADLGKCALSMLSVIARTFSYNISDRSGEANEPRHNNHVLTQSAELSKMLKDLYGDIVIAVLDRFRNIEMIVNKNKAQAISNAFADVSIKVPGDKKSDVSQEDNMMDAVPDTSRLPLDMYAMPTYESLRMYSEYANYILGDDTYFSEAFDFSKIVDTLQALIAGFFKKAIQFFDSPRLKAAAGWVEKNKTALETMKFSGTMDVLPYKSNIKYPSFNDFTNVLNNTFKADMLEDRKEFDKFIERLYHNNDNFLQEIWQSDSKDMNKDVSNYVLFGIKPDEELSTKSLTTSEAIETEMKNTWVSTMESAKVIRDAFISGEKAADSAVKNLKTKLVSGANNTTKSTQTPTNTNDTTGGGNTDANQNNDSANTPDVTPQNAIAEIQRAYQRIIFPTYMIFHKAITDQYGYIQTAYNMRVK